MNIKTLKCRDDLGEWLNANRLTGQGVEVGSFYGDFARSIMFTWNGEQLFMIDPWDRQDPAVYREPLNDTNWSNAYHSCRSIVDQYPGKVTMLRAYSPDAAKWFTDGLDFVYIDARHDLEAVRADIVAWWPKVKRGGLFGGHDYRVEHNETQCCDVQTAVDEFAAKIGMEPHITRAPGCYSWWFIKP